MKVVKGLYDAARSDVGGLVTYQALPDPRFGTEWIEPFLLLNHHGPQIYPPGNAGLPFGPHPHRGFETVTFVLAGDLMHKDSGGSESLIVAGGVQWMTAGRGLIHAEVSSEEFKRKGGPVEILQLWVNLPARLKMTEPRYRGLQLREIPALKRSGGRVLLDLVSGEWFGKRGVFETLTDVSLSLVHFDPGGKVRFDVPSGHSVLFYVVAGMVMVNHRRAWERQTVEFYDGGNFVEVTARSEAVILFGHAPRQREPIVSYGPFVMNTMAELDQALRDYGTGKFGDWEDYKD